MSIRVEYSPKEVEMLLAATAEQVKKPSSKKPTLQPKINESASVTTVSSANTQATAIQSLSPKEKLISVAKGCEEIFLTKLGFFIASLVGGGFFAKAGVLGTGLYQLHDRITKARASEGGIRTMFDAPLTKSEKMFLLTIGQCLGFSLLPNGALLVGAASFLLTGVKPRYNALNRVSRLCIKPQWNSITDQTPILTVLKTGFRMAKHTSAAVFDPQGTLQLKDEEFSPPKDTVIEKAVAKAGPTVGQLRENSILDGFLTAAPSNPKEKPSVMGRLKAFFNKSKPEIQA